MTDDYVRLDGNCVFCAKRVFCSVTPKQLQDYNSGVLVQYAFPNLTADQRQFVISRICEKCYDKILPKEK